MTQLPAVSLAAVPGRRLRTIELAQEIERRGFPVFLVQAWAIACLCVMPSPLAPSDVIIGTSITPIYTRIPRGLCANSRISARYPRVVALASVLAMRRKKRTAWALPQ